jgi:hypothetical protein
VVSRELVAAEGREGDVRRIFGPTGIWSELLGRAAGYLGSELICQSRRDRRYRARDFWTSHWEFEWFRERHQRECERFAELIASERILEREIFLGAYYEDEPGDETDIVPA